MTQMTLARVKEMIAAHPDFPQKGILFQDIFPIFQDPQAVACLVDEIVTNVQTHSPKVDCIVGLDARGFLLGPVVAMRLQCAFVPVRKGGKLPGAVHQFAYEKEYGTDMFEIPQNAVKQGWQCVVLDDLLATGGSAYAAKQLIFMSKGARVTQYVFLIELTALQGAKKLTQDGARVTSLFQFDD